MKTIRFLANAFALVLLVFFYSQYSPADEQVIPLPQAPNVSHLAEQFGRYYKPIPLEVKADIPAYSLPLKGEDIQNFSTATPWLLQKGAKELLFRNGFVTITWEGNEDVVQAYKEIKKFGIPVFVTTDSLLHLYHIQFDETLKQIEEKKFYPDLIKISKAMNTEFLKRAEKSSGITQKAYRKGVAFFTIGLKLLDPHVEVPKQVKSWVAWELRQIEDHKGFPSAEEAQEKSLFQYMEDYSQYVPRGHYTQSEPLKRYFKAMMWYGRMTMLIRGDEKKYGPFAEKALVSKEEAKIQTMLAATIAGLAGVLKIDNQLLMEKWNRMYAVSAYYVGFSDDLTIYEYQEALQSVFRDTFKPEQLADDKTFFQFQTKIAGLRKPAIYSGTGQSGVNLEEVGAMKPEQLVETLAKTQGFRFMGQRYVPDSFILGQMVTPTIDKLTGKPCFTTVEIPDFGPIRGFPRGLDVMAVLGSKRALSLLDTLGDSNYGRYHETLEKLKKQFSAVSEKEWNQNLYWSWLYALKALTSEPESKGWPTFSQTDAWKDKQLNAALGSWSGLRHDTILYVKQSYTMTIRAEAALPEVPRELPIVGYVEPVPEFYARLVALTKMTQRGLDDLKVLDEQSKNRLNALDQVLSRILNISIRELENHKLTQEDYDFIASFADQINAIVTGAGESTQKTTMIADVHTDQNTTQVLEEGTGYLRLILVAYKLPEGHILVGAGPVYSYYEFKQPMADRLTDEKWREILRSGNVPTLPEWTKSFSCF